MTYRAHGKQVKRGAEHVCDAADPTWAQIITDALNGERHPTAPIRQMLAERCGSNMVNNDVIETARHREHNVARQNDEYACSCGRRWDASDGPAHPS